MWIYDRKNQSKYNWKMSIRFGGKIDKNKTRLNLKLSSKHYNVSFYFLDWLVTMTDMNKTNNICDDFWTTAMVFLLDCRLFSLLVCSPSWVLLHDLSLGCQTVLQFQQACLTRYIGSAFLSESSLTCTSWTKSVCTVWCPGPVYLLLPS